ncbi:hypothetical protein ACKI2N_031285 [Cupriavidus sp. 30B13]
MKQLTHHFHANPPHHGARYYMAIAACMLVPAAAYLLWTSMSAAA